MKRLLIPLLCLWHMSAIAWWTLPYSFSWLAEQNSSADSLEYRLLVKLSPTPESWLGRFFIGYIDLTGSQQYWDFFAPQSPKFHQYLSVCTDISTLPAQQTIVCKGNPLFSNLADHYTRFEFFGSGRSRWYRLTESLIRHNDPALLQQFTAYYQRQASVTGKPAFLVAHQFELHPEITDMPIYGYRSDKVLYTLP
jgi:hypothetical protein